MCTNLPEKWDIETDVVVVGYGGAGAVAAITASDNGAAVTILEKMPSGGGNTRVCGGGILNPTDMQFAGYMETICAGTTEPVIIRTYVEKAMKNGDWIRSAGGDVQPQMALQVSYPGASPKASFPKLPNSQFMVKYNVKGPADEPNAERLWKLLSGNVARRPINIVTGAPAEELITGQNGEVIGVTARRDGQKLAFKARKGVILTCGGFEYDEATKNDFLPCRPFYAFGNPGNTGDGIRMAQKAGAGVWHMPATSGQLGLKVPDFQAAFIIRFFTERFIFVDRDARRFLNETGLEVHEIAARVSVFDTDRFIYPHIPVYAIFDEPGRRKAPINPGNSGFNRTLYKWSKDNSAEIDKGWIVKGKNIAELAHKISFDEGILEETVLQYNESCRTGKDAEFGRSRETLAPIDTPPYYAVVLWPSLINTQGGPRRDVRARVLDAMGRPIPRLYSAGELGSVWGFMYQGSGNIAECIVFGQIAGQNAAAQKPWG
ncbi:MAG: FAD-binding protein [Chloroflexi bacterium]|nr:FAD-binding protein [Chloroflexota bacterium]